MSLDLYQDQIDDRLGSFRPTDRPESGVFDGFLKGTGMFAMRNFARAGSAVDLAGAAGPIVKEALGVGRPGEVDQYFKEHDDIFGSAIKYWTPKPEEVGVAAEVAGGLLSTIPLVIASPAFAVGTTYMGTAEELMQKGVSPGKAQAVGAAQAVGLGLGVWMPILGQNLWQRIFVGGAGFNTAQGIVLRGASGALLDGTPAGEEFKAFDGKALTLDALLGMAFGSFAHISPAQRAQSADAWERLGTWAGKLEPSQVDALAALRQAQHSNVDSAPGKLAGVQDVQAHVDRVRTALDQLAKGDQVAVDDKPMPQFEPDAKREAAAEKRVTALQDIAERVRKEEGLPVVEAYHGSPHDFDQFDVSRVGTGEGVQAYGHGLYFAENKATAKSYADTVKDMAKIDATNKRLRELADVMEKEKIPGEYRQYKTDAARAADEEYHALIEKKMEPGTLYRVNIAGEAVAKMLDWHKPMPEQPGNVRLAFDEALAADPVYQAWKKNGAYEHLSGQLAYRRLVDTLGPAHGGPQGAQGAQQAKASDALRQAGVPGISYLDQGSRATGAGTRNFVLFDSSLAKIVEKNGQKTEAPAASSAVAEPPPPRGNRPGEAAGAEAPHPALVEAERLVTERPDLQIKTGADAEGKAVTVSAKDYLEQAKTDAAKSREDAKLIAAAAQCLMGII